MIISIRGKKVRLKEIFEKLDRFLVEAETDYNYISGLLITYAKKSDIVDTKKTKKIYTKVSEEIINNQIIKYLNKE